MGYHLISLDKETDPQTEFDIRDVTDETVYQDYHGNIQN